MCLIRVNRSVSVLLEEKSKKVENREGRTVGFWARKGRGWRYFKPIMRSVDANML